MSNQFDKVKFAKELKVMLAGRTFNQASEITGISPVRISRYARGIFDKPMNEYELKNLMKLKEDKANA
jgi:uncharacterized protein YerC